LETNNPLDAKCVICGGKPSLESPTDKDDVTAQTQIARTQPAATSNVEHMSMNRSMSTIRLTSLLRRLKAILQQQK
jgi:hypothetical protein